MCYVHEIDSVEQFSIFEWQFLPNYVWLLHSHAMFIVDEG